MEMMTNNEFSRFLIKLIHGDSVASAMNLAQLQHVNFRINLNSLDNRNECAHSKNVVLIEWPHIDCKTQAPTVTQQKCMEFKESRSL
jgi:hypothetical protein